MERNYNNNLEIREREVVEVEKSFDMCKIVDYVLNAIEDSKSKDMIRLEKALTCNTQEIMTGPEREYCRDILTLIEISNSSKYVKKLFTAEGFDMFKLKPEIKYDDYVSLTNKNVIGLRLEQFNIEYKLKRDYALYKYPIIKEIMDSFFEWYKTEIDYKSVLDDLMSELDYKGKVDIDSFILEYVGMAIASSKISDFTDYGVGSTEGTVWNYFKQIVNYGYIEEHYADLLDTFREEFFDTYM